MFKLSKFFIVFGIAILLATLISYLYTIGFLSNLELDLSDNLYGGKTPLDAIVIVAIDDKSLQEIGRWPWDRSVMADVLPKLSGSKVIGIDIAFFEDQDAETDLELGTAIYTAGNVVLPAEYTEFEIIDGKVVGTELLETIPVIASEAVGIGYINVINDYDGKTRAINPAVVGDYESFAYEVYKNYWSVPIEDELEDHRLLINFVGPRGTFTQYSFVDVLNGDVDSSAFENKLVLIGVTSPDLHDEAVVPNSAKPMPGVEIHANTIQTMITQDFLHKEAKWLVILMIFLLAIGTAMLFYYAPVWLSPIVLFALIILQMFFAIFMFNYNWIINILYVPSTLIMTYMVVTLYYYISEKNDRKKVLGAFEKYVSKDVISHIMENPDKLKLGGEKRELTVFFSDIRGFTTISEALGPERLVALLNEYLTEMTNIILQTDGVVDKYMGDAIMAFWGAPLEQPKHAERACNASLMMEKRLKELQVKWTKEGVPPLEVGIGLNTGDAVVGNMGAEDRFDYTAMGDTINLGARLESINKQYGTRILVSAATRKKVKGKGFVFRKIDMVTVKGKTEPVTIYELAGSESDCEKWCVELMDEFEKGLNLYFKQKWSEAILSFKKCLKIRKKGDGKKDGPATTFIERCEYFKKNSPGAKWNGVCVMKTK